MPLTATAPPPPPATPLLHSAPGASPPQYNLPVTAPAPAPTSVTQSRPAPAPCPSTETRNPLIFPLNQPPPLVPPSFDTSRPPPPIPPHIQVNNQHLKRKVDSANSAGPSKLRKPEGSELTESLCDSCVQREMRINSYKLQMDVLHNEEETQILTYKKKLQEYELGKDILKALVGPDLYLLFNELIEGTQTPQISINSASSFISGSSTVPMQALMSLFEMFLNGSQRNMMEPLSSSSRIEETLQALTSLSRLNVASYTNASPDLLNLVRESLRTSSAPERPPLEVPSNDISDVNRMSNTRANGFNHLTSGPSSGGATYSTANVQHSQDYGARVPAPSFPVAAPCSGGAPVPSVNPMYHPAIPPPPNRLFFGHNNTVPSRAPGLPPLMPPLPNFRPNAPNINYMPRYPQQPFYPPYQ